ncbi:DMT family transporter [Paractinoplanes hotanensis]|uniref:DMT family transporter n=1 Tax=Paractinoplanes hotanensis TaxID=2906497 RepID=A0ABT0Y3M0_9ACTN|nr:DMT family transporter [Actinoplanes hotanensis]MCM4080638.1 DMT family transporter [Actinoplanes hotanensis]
MGSLGWAVALSVLSAASYAAAAVAQERLAEHGQRGWSRWAVALLLTGGGVVLHVIALNFGTVAVVQALGTLTLLFALPIAAVRLQTPISRAAWTDALLTVIGLALILSLSVEPSEPRRLVAPDDRNLVLITLAVVAALALGAWSGGPRMRSVLLAAAAGTAFGISSVLSKAVLAAVTDGGVRTVSPVGAIAVLVFATGGYLLSQLSYGRAGMAAPLATVSVSNPIVAATTGVVVFGEGFRFGAAGLVVIAFAAVMMTLGVIGLARQAATRSSSDGSADPATRADIPA